MEKEKIIEIANNSKEKPNKVLISARNNLFDEYEKTKKLIIDLTRHLESIEIFYEKINKEIGNRGL